MHKYFCKSTLLLMVLFKNFDAYLKLILYKYVRYMIPYIELAKYVYLSASAYDSQWHSQTHTHTHTQNNRNYQPYRQKHAHIQHTNTHTHTQETKTFDTAQ